MFQQEFEWLTSNTRVAYPFVERVAVPTGADGTPFSDLVVDAYVAYQDAVQEDVRLVSLGDPSASSVDVEFRYAGGAIAFSSVGAAFNKATLGVWTMLEWVKGDGAARILLETAKISQFTWPAVLVDAYLVGHALQPIQSFVNSFTAESNTFNGTVELVGGYNVNLSVQTDLLAEASARAKTKVQIEATAGEGLGTYPNCSFETPPIFTINGVGPDEQGNFLLNPKDCYRGQIPITNELTGPPWRFLKNAFKLRNDCSPCCECEDYIYVYDELLRRVFNAAKVVSDRFYRVRDQYRALYEQIQAQKACREQPRVDMKLIGRQGWCVAVQLIVYNNGGCDCDEVTLTIDMTGPGGYTVPDAQRIDTDDIEHKPFTLQGTWPTYQISFTDGVRGARSLIATFEIYFPIGARAPGAPVTGTVTGTVDGKPVSDTATTTLTQVFNKF